MGRTAFWILLPFLMIFVIGMLWVDIFRGTFGSIGVRITIVGICAVVGALGLIFYDLERFWWAGKLVAAFILLTYVAYVIGEWFFSGHKWNYAWRSGSAASPLNSILGLVVFGIPAFFYLFGEQFRWHGKEPDAEPRHFNKDIDDEDGDKDEEHGK